MYWFVAEMALLTKPGCFLFYLCMFVLQSENLFRSSWLTNKDKQGSETLMDNLDVLALQIFCYYLKA